MTPNDPNLDEAIKYVAPLIRHAIENNLCEVGFSNMTLHRIETILQAAQECRRLKALLDSAAEVNTKLAMDRTNLRAEISRLKEQQPERVTKDTLRMLGVSRTGLQLADYLIHAYNGDGLFIDYCADKQLNQSTQYVRKDLAPTSQWLSVDKITVDAQRGLDQISVYFENFEKGAGKVIIHCYDMAWTAYWGAMGDKSIQQFFVGCDVGYLTDRLTSGQFYSRAKYHDDYMVRIVTAIQVHMKNPPTKDLAAEGLK